VGFVADKVALGQIFSEYFGFPCQFAFHQLLHNSHHHFSSEAGKIGQLAAAVPVDPISPREKSERSMVSIRKLDLL
jgi:hypothetical protein